MMKASSESQKITALTKEFPAAVNEIDKQLAILKERIKDIKYDYELLVEDWNIDGCLVDKMQICSFDTIQKTRIVHIWQAYMVEAYNRLFPQNKKGGLYDVIDLYREIKARKPYVKWTISPAGVWRNKNPLSEYAGCENGSDTKSYNPNFDALHADVLLWMFNGEKTPTLSKATVKDGLNRMYVDAIIPQIYWSSSHQTAPFDIIADWWINEAKKSRSGNLADLYIGHALYKMGRDTNVEPWQDIDLMSKQVEYIREKGKGYVKGSTFFTMHSMYKNDRDSGDFGNEALKYIKENDYIFKAIVPTMNTMKDLRKAPLKLENPTIKKVFGGIEITFTDPNEYKTDKYNHAAVSTSTYYAIYRETIGEYGIELIDKIRRTNFDVNSKVKYKDKTVDSKKTYIYYVTALDRIHNESEYLKIIN